ncbi:MAG: helix-turn-helix transcriptional regulator [Acutalibacteraceae bacterium]|nr:helix-turn-helix transcriptional regulator [Acutalibacteraceae bacterium]
MDNNIGKRIADLIKALNMRQVEFGEAIKVNQSYISKLIVGKRIPSDRTISYICNEFDVNEEWLRTGEGSMFIERTKDEELSYLIGKLLSDEEDSFKKRLIAALLKLDETEWKTVEKIAEEITKG